MRTDTHELFSLIEECRNYLRPWLFWVDATRSPEDIQSALDRITNPIEQPLGIFHRNKLAGLISVKHFDEANFSCEIGYWLAEKYQGNSIMFSACKMLINYLFRESAVNRIEIGVATNNHRSRNIPEKLGFFEEGIKRCAVYINDGFQDYVIYSLLKKDWNSRT